MKKLICFMMAFILMMQCCPIAMAAKSYETDIYDMSENEMGGFQEENADVNVTDDDGKEGDEESSCHTSKIKAPYKVQSLKQTSAGRTSVTIQWKKPKKAPNAVSYEVTWGKKKVNTNKTKLNISKLGKGSSTKVSVRAYVTKSDGTKLYSGKTNVTVRTKPKKIQLKSLYHVSGNESKKGLGSAQLGKKGNEQGYRVEVWTGYGNKSKKIKSYHASRKELNNGINVPYSYNVYKVRICGYVKVNGKKVYGSWSEWKYVCYTYLIRLGVWGFNGELSNAYLVFARLKGADRAYVQTSDDNKNWSEKFYFDPNNNLRNDGAEANIDRIRSMYIKAVYQKKVKGKWVIVGVNYNKYVMKEK